MALLGGRGSGAGGRVLYDGWIVSYRSGGFFLPGDLAPVMMSAAADLSEVTSPQCGGTLSLSTDFPVLSLRAGALLGVPTVFFAGANQRAIDCHIVKRRVSSRLDNVLMRALIVNPEMQAATLSARAPGGSPCRRRATPFRRNDSHRSRQRRKPTASSRRHCACRCNSSCSTMIPAIVASRLITPRRRLTQSPGMLPPPARRRTAKAASRTHRSPCVRDQSSNTSWPGQPMRGYRQIGRWPSYPG